MLPKVYSVKAAGPLLFPLALTLSALYLRGCTDVAFTNSPLIATTRTLVKSSGVTKSWTEAPRQFFLTSCTMVRNEVPYIVEWIEFMKLQGVDRFIIYDDASSDNVTLLEEFYRGRDAEAVVIVERAPEVSLDKRQDDAFQHCLQSYGRSTKWMMVSDTDEFLFSEYYGTLKNLLVDYVPLVEHKQRKPVTILSEECVNFGTSGRQHRFQYTMSYNETGHVEYRNGCGVQMILDNVRRGPHPRVPFVAGEVELFPSLHKSMPECNASRYPPPCDHSPGKAIFRPSHVSKAGVHSPKEWKNITGAGDIWYNHREVSKKFGWIAMMQCNHYKFRSREDVTLKSSLWMMPEHVLNYRAADHTFWMALQDDRLKKRWHYEMSKRLSALTTISGPCPSGMEL